MNPYFIEHKTLNNLINGLSITITSGNNLYYTDCYELLSPITDIFYKAIGNPVKSTIYTKPPTDIQLQLTLETKRLICAYVIAPHKNGETHHIHGFIYGLQNFNIPTNDFITYVNKEIKLKLKKLSSNNKHSVLLKPIEDLLDKKIREDNSYEPLLHYIKDPEFNSYTHYLKHKNSSQFIYSYL